MKRILFLVLLLAVVSVTQTEAQRKAGRNGAAFLEIGVGAREVALGSAVTSLSDDATQAFWNPAGTALKGDQTWNASFSYNQWIADIDHVALAAGYRALNGTITISAQALGVSGIPANRQNGYADPILQALVTDKGTDAEYDYSDVSFGVTYSKYVLDRLSLGATVKYISESIDTESASAMAFDFGSVWTVGIGNWAIAARLSNLGSKMSFYNQDNPLPLTFSIGSNIFFTREDMALMLIADATKTMDSSQAVFGGAEVSFYDVFFVRGGYKFNYSGSNDGGTSERSAIDTTIEGASVGAGIVYPVSGYDISVDYAYTDMDLLSGVHRITLKVGG